MPDPAPIALRAAAAADLPELARMNRALISEEFNSPANIAHVRQFFIERQYRQRGLGRQAFDLLVAEQFPPGSTVVLEVLASNPGGLQFWSRLGFEPHYTTLRRPPNAGTQ